MRKKTVWTVLGATMAFLIFTSCGTMQQPGQAQLLSQDIKDVSTAVVALYPGNEKVAAGVVVANRLADELAAGNLEAVPLLLALEPKIREALGEELPPHVEVGILAIKMALRRMSE